MDSDQITVAVQSADADADDFSAVAQELEIDQTQVNTGFDDSDFDGINDLFDVF